MKLLLNLIKKKNFLSEHRILGGILFVFIAVFLYQSLPDLFSPKPTLLELSPSVVMEGTSFNNENIFTIRGKNLTDVCSIYINGKLDKNCWLRVNTENEILITLPEYYLAEAQEIEMQFETHPNSDKSYVSNKVTLDIMSDEGIPKPIITKVEPENLKYSGSLSQEILLYGEGFTENSIIMIDKVAYPTQYDAEKNCLKTKIGFAEWCSKSSMTLEVIQYYNGYPTTVKSEGYICEVIKKQQTIEEVSLSAPIIECSSWDEIIEHYAKGERNFSVNLSFSEDGILYIAEETMKKELPFPPKFDNTKHMSFLELCNRIAEYPELYLYVKFAEASTLESLSVCYETLLETVTETGRKEEIFSRIVTLVSDDVSYYWMKELDASVIHTSKIKKDVPVAEAGPGKKEVFIQYLDKLNSERYLVFFVAQDEASNAMTDEIQQKLHGLGLQQSLVGKFRNSYIAVMNQGSVVHEAIGTELLTYEGEYEGVLYQAQSGNANVGSVASVKIDGTEYAVNSRGLNIVVYDTLLNKVLDSVCFDTFGDFSMKR